MTPPPPPPHPSFGVIAAARWQDGWAVKLSNPPPRTLGVSGGWGNALPTAESVGGNAGGAKQSASHAARGAVTMGFVSTVIVMVMIVSGAVFMVLRRASHGGGGGVGTFLWRELVCVWPEGGGSGCRIPYD